MFRLGDLVVVNIPCIKYGEFETFSGIIVDSFEGLYYSIDPGRTQTMTKYTIMTCQKGLIRCFEESMTLMRS